MPASPKKQMAHRWGRRLLIGGVSLFFFTEMRVLLRLIDVSFDVAQTQTHAPITPIREKRLGDGCYHVFLDVGSNLGIHGRFLFEPDVYPDSQSSVSHFGREFGMDRDNRDICVFAFEPNPKFAQRQLDLAAAYQAMGWRYHPLLAGAADRDGNMTFYHTHMENNEKKENGFNAVAPKTLYGDAATPKTVQIYRLATWLKREIHDRILPNKPYMDVMEPRVVMKLDIEGIEYKVFPDLLLTGALCETIHFLIGEFHYSPSHTNYFPMNLTSDGRHSLNSRKDAQNLATSLLRLVDASENCMTRYSLEDDESYSDDGMDFPKPPPTEEMSS